MAPVTSVFQSVDSVLAQMITQIQSQGSLITDFTQGSVARSIFEAFAIVVSENSAIADQLQLDTYLDTATGPALDAIASNFIVTRNAAVQATGQVTITRQSTTSALLLPTGFTQLATSPSVPGTAGVSVLTTADANFAVGVASVAVTAQAVIGGAAGNLAALAYLTPLAPVNGVSSQNGFQVTTAFTGGVDAETDAALRVRIPLAVQGRVKGIKAAFQAAALGVPGVLSVGVLPAGTIRGDGSAVPAGSVEAYYQGSAGLLTAVQTAVGNAAVLNQSVTAFASISLTPPRGQQRIVATVTVYIQAGVDPVATGTAVASALQTYVNGTGIGATVRTSQAIQAIHALQYIVSVGLPLTQFSLFGGSGAADMVMAKDSYANLAASDTLVTVTTLT